MSKRKSSQLTSAVYRAIKNADGSLFEAAMRDEVVDKERARFVAAAHQRLSPEENEQAWADFSALCAKVFQRGRFWAPEYLWALAPLLLMLAAEIDEIDRVEAAFEAIGDSDELAALITSPCAPTPSLLLVDRISCALDAKAQEVELEPENFFLTGRRLAGYLSDAAQPKSSTP